ncbi:MAG: ribokinase [Paracoccaceae bacterium]|nr:ribokinase [Paracoccaceae bacterium]
MTIFNLGSINVDHVYQVPHLPLPGETLAAVDLATGLGGKGANQSVAAARAGATTLHIGAIGSDGGWILDRLRGFGVNTTHIATLTGPTGHAIINVDRAGENAIVLLPGANFRQEQSRIDAALASAVPGDTLLLQNETTLQPDAAHAALSQGLRVIYSAAPFDIAAVRAVLPFVSMLVVNEVEAAQLTAALGKPLTALTVPDIIVTKGAQGAEWISAGTEPIFTPAFRVKPVDTTGAGDCFIGSLAAALDRGLTRPAAMRYAAAAAALQVMRPGATDAMPTRAEVETFLSQH